MRGFFIHAVVYAVVNALLVGAWLLTTGSTTELSNVQGDPLQAVRDGFWPLIVAAVWGGALVIHAGVVMASFLPSSKRKRARRQRREKVWQAAVAHDRDRRHNRQLPHSAPPPVPPVNADLAKDA